MTDSILFWCAVVALVFSFFAQIKVSSTFSKYSRMNTGAARPASEVAAMILRASGVGGIRIERVSGNLTDHYDPKARVLRLSDTVYSSSSAAAVGVAAHEAGHAIQHAKGYIPIKIRMAMIPAVTFASRMTWIVIFAGIIVMSLVDTAIGYYVTLAGIGLFAVATLFELVTLPCEFNASRRAMNALADTGLYTQRELRASHKVLTAAALTYVAALAVSVLQLVRLLLRLSRNRR